MIRLIASDLDGTLLEKNGKLPEGTFETVLALEKLGIRFAACSGRQYANIRRLFGPVAEHMSFICENGAFCMANGAEMGTIPIPDAMAREIIEDIGKLGMNLLISGKHTCYMLDQDRRYTDDITYRLRNTVTIIEHTDMITEPILKISGQRDNGVREIAPILLDKWAKRLTATVSGRDWFDFTVANKGMGIRMLMNRLEIAPEETLAFGDQFNDETMLDSVGFPFLMEWADHALRKPGVRLCNKVLPVIQTVIDAKGDPLKAFL